MLKAVTSERIMADEYSSIFGQDIDSGCTGFQTNDKLFL